MKIKLYHVRIDQQLYYWSSGEPAPGLIRKWFIHPRGERILPHVKTIFVPDITEKDLDCKMDMQFAEDCLVGYDTAKAHYDFWTKKYAPFPDMRVWLCDEPPPKQVVAVNLGTGEKQWGW